MLLETYNKEELLININVNAATSDGAQRAFRGDLVLVEGEFHELSGKKLAPKAVLNQAVMLGDGDKIKFMGGCLRTVDLLPIFVEKYGADLAEECQPIFYVYNLRESFKVDMDGKEYVLIGLEEGMVWNELMDELYLEKSDFKGQSSGDKLITMYDGAKDYKPKYAMTPFTEVKSKAIELGEGRGAV
uniref:Uncharacterized protein n=1 Tax=Magnetococcus massalia (strain MO-1) TaxID=451514 RepID=A0A1S7LCR7_MAGMO|nr:conserved protein of unknown function [Candidatus Magnetococcus massalia]